MILVTGAGGFVGGHLVARLLADGHRVRAVDRLPSESWQQLHSDAANFSLDVSEYEEACEACDGCTEVYALAADMGGIGFIESNKLACMLSVLATVNTLRAAALCGVGRLFYSSSACIYPAYAQRDAADPALKEEDAYPAEAEDGYGWEKLFGERLCRHFAEEARLETRVARYHNVYGTMGQWRGGREKAPAALCRKVAEAKLKGTGEVAVWGDGKQTRSFMRVADCVEGTLRIMRSDCREPLNLGSDELVTVDQLLDAVEEAAGTRLRRIYDLAAPQGVRGRCSDNAKILATLGWAPLRGLREGIAELYRWVEARVKETM